MTNKDTGTVPSSPVPSSLKSPTPERNVPQRSNLQSNRLRRDKLQRIVGSLLVIVALMVTILTAMGRTPWCKCGSIVPWSWQIHSMHNSQHLIDPYTFTHLLHGLVFFGALWLARHRLSETVRWIACGAIEAAWEILENTPLIIDRYRETTISLDYYGDSISNSVSDVLACLLGYALASRLRWFYTLAIFVAVEMILLATIRDSLILNVIMLLMPSDAIGQWQNAAG